MARKIVPLALVQPRWTSDPAGRDVAVHVTVRAEPALHVSPPFGAVTRMPGVLLVRQLATVVRVLLRLRALFAELGLASLTPVSWPG